MRRGRGRTHAVVVVAIGDLIMRDPTMLQCA
jgi:hypothetical protein